MRLLRHISEIHDGIGTLAAGHRCLLETRLFPAGFRAIETEKGGALWSHEPLGLFVHVLGQWGLLRVHRAFGKVSRSVYVTF